MIWHLDLFRRRLRHPTGGRGDIALAALDCTRHSDGRVRAGQTESQAARQQEQLTRSKRARYPICCSMMPGAAQAVLSLLLYCPRPAESAGVGVDPLRLRIRHAPWCLRGRAERVAKSALDCMTGSIPSTFASPCSPAPVKMSMRLRAVHEQTGRPTSTEVPEAIEPYARQLGAFSNRDRGTTTHLLCATPCAAPVAVTVASAEAFV